METRFLAPVGVLASADVEWDGCPEDTDTGQHFAEHEIRVEGETSYQAVEYPYDKLTACKFCNAPVPEDEGDDGPWRGGSKRVLYDTESGRPEPGDLFFVEMHPGGRCYNWDNCPGRHLTAVLPNGHYWDIDSRSSNCTRPDDKTHRCWVRHGDPEKGEPVHVDKNGETCQAGAGSILAGDYHGFLHHGHFTQA